MSSRNPTSPRYNNIIGVVDDLRAHVPGAAVAIVLGKLDGLETINSRYGYAAGDKVISVFHAKLRDMARENDVTIEISGSIFAFIVHNPMNEGHVSLAADKIARLAEDWVEINDIRMRLEVSMGCALADSPRETTTALLQKAETALRRCRQNDQRVQFWSEAADETLGTAQHPLFDAHKAIENGEFRVHYQPQVSLKTGSLVGVEALVRWSGPNGLVAPGSFMNELERARALMPLLQFVMNSASREMSRWVRRMPDLSVAINASATDLEDADLAQIMGNVLGMWNLDPRNLKLEITETVLSRHPELGARTLAQLRELGVRTSVDDFGTGYSSLSWLKQLPVDELKIDKSFVSRMIDDQRDRRIVVALIDLAHALNLSVVAEGVESEGIEHMLREAGCDVAQGYFYSRPLSAAEFERTWLVELPAESVTAD